MLQRELPNRLDLRRLHPELAIAARRRRSAEAGEHIDPERAVERRDLAQIPLRVALDSSERSIELARETVQASLEGGPRQDLLLQEARNLVAPTAEAALRAVEGERRLSRDETLQPDRLREVRSDRLLRAEALAGSPATTLQRSGA
jgi:hypothetical protein